MSNSETRAEDIGQNEQSAVCEDKAPSSPVSNKRTKHKTKDRFTGKDKEGNTVTWEW